MAFRGGFLVGIGNPKLLVFAAAFFPQFIAEGAPRGRRVNHVSGVDFVGFRLALLRYRP